jgi:hypothetical protein
MAGRRSSEDDANESPASPSLLGVELAILRSGCPGTGSSAIESLADRICPTASWPSAHAGSPARMIASSPKRSQVAAGRLISRVRRSRLGR